MARINPLTPAEVAPETREIFVKFYEKRGNVPNMFRTFALRPEMMVAANQLMGAVLNTGTLSVTLKEMVIVRTSQINGCTY